MILVIGGTTEGRESARVLDEAGEIFYYSTRGTEQQINTKNGIRLTGTLDVESMSDFCLANSIKVIVDAAHPFAIMIHENVSKVAQLLNLSVIRYERIYPDRSDDVIWCEDYNDACEKLEHYGCNKLLALTGVKTISNLKPFWEKHDCFFRVLNRNTSVSLAYSQGVTPDKLLYYTGENDLEHVINQTGVDAILTKESGLSGGFKEKKDAARNANAQLYAVKRPKLDCLNIYPRVNGPHGLRRQIELVLPGFYKLRTGFTTGSCATAASKAALICLLEQCKVYTVDFVIPNGETMTMRIDRCEWTSSYGKAYVFKDAGDDPDVTNGIEICSEVRFVDNPGVKFLQGEGVGKVTLPGLGINVGEPAINPVPRMMISNELRKIYKNGLEVTISVPNGKIISQKTLNDKVGVVDGISILGTSGIVSPLSSDAYIESISREIDVCVAIGSKVLILNSGAKSEQTIKKVYKDTSPQAFVHYGNFIGEALMIAYEKGIQEVRIGIMIGKAVKLAEGNLDTHSHKVLINKDFLCDIAKKTGCSTETLRLLSKINLARDIWSIIPECEANLFFIQLLDLCIKSCRVAYPYGKLSLLLINEDDAVPYSLTSTSVLQ